MREKVIIIAEAGVNHNGSLEMAKRLVEEAAKAGADYIKFQTFKSEGIVTKTAEQASYQKKNTGVEESQLAMLKKLELPFDDFKYLYNYCMECGIKFLSTSTDTGGINFLRTLDMDAWKIPSGEVTDYLYLRKVASYNMETFFSTGMSDLQEVKNAVDVLMSNGLDKSKITLLHCTTQYPTPYEDVNLRAMLTLKEEFGTNVGYSDHTMGIEVPIAAVAMGAKVIEKHFTLDRTLPGPDHKASLEPQELKALVSAIRHIEAAMGNGEKVAANSERENISVARRSIVAKCDINAGEIFTEENITTKRPGNGISPMRWNDVIGTRAIRDFKEDELIEL